ARHRRGSRAMSFVDKNFPILLALVGIGWFLTRQRYGLRVAVLLAASLYFYGRWWWLAVILAYCVADWATGVLLERSAHRRAVRAAVLATGVGFNVAVLAFWKYTPLLASSAHALF